MPHLTPSDRLPVKARFRSRWDDLPELVRAAVLAVLLSVWVVVLLVVI
jgi:hypothetical protein